MPLQSWSPSSKNKGYYRKVAFYDADVAEDDVFEGWNADGDYFSPEQVRGALLFIIWSNCKVGTPCPIACAPYLPTSWAWASRSVTQVSAQPAAV